MTYEDRMDLVRAAKGDEYADIVFQNCDLFNPFDCTWERTGFGVTGGVVIGTGPYIGRRAIDLNGRKVVPGLIDAHVHIESSLLRPEEYTRLVSAHGTTTVIADPHEIANVCGTAGILSMCKVVQGLPVDIFFMLPSCVPASQADMGGALPAFKQRSKRLLCYTASASCSAGRILQSSHELGTS